MYICIYVYVYMYMYIKYDQTGFINEDNLLS
jgi:hypothetical protein